MNKAHKSFIWIFLLVLVVAIAGIFLWHRSGSKEVIMDKGVAITPDQLEPTNTLQSPSSDERIEGVDTRVLLYSNGRKPGDSNYYGTQADVIKVVDAFKNEVITTVSTQITPDIRGANNQYYLVGDRIYFYNLTDRMVEVLDFSGNLAKLAFTQSPENRYYQNFIVSSDGNKIAWARSAKGSGSNLRTAMWVANIDGTEQKLLQEKEIGPERYFNLFRFSGRNDVLYYSEEGGGRGGYILFAGLTNLYSITLDETKVSAIVSKLENGYIIDLSYDEKSYAAVMGVGTEKPTVVVRDAFSEDQEARNNLVRSTISFPLSSGYTVAGDVAFSPDANTVAYTEAVNNPDKEQFQIKVGKLGSADVNNKMQTLVEASASLYRSERWITNSLILLSSDVNPGVKYTVRADGAELKAVGAE